MMSSAPDLRASDTERDEAVALLRERAGAGRLTIEELDERCSAALPARTRGEPVAKQPGRLAFSYSRRPAWTFAVAILGFPPGLLALLHTHEERVVLDFDTTPGGGTRLVVSGRAPRNVRRAFAELEV